ncbi:MAG: hypothetical protein LBH22_02745 [Bacteroidales bacterium]|jgi:hypothetical protein|nr:hypothetical protein [Bacteroidales bacterium]
MSNKKFIISLVIIIVVTLTLIASLFFTIPDSNKIDSILIKDTVRFEILKSLFQLLFVIIVGGVIAYFFKSQEAAKKEENNKKEKEKEKRSQSNEIRVEYLDRLGKIYRNVKKTRRILTAGGLTSKYGNPPSIMTEQLICLYCEQMEHLNNNQLELECLKIESKSIPAIVNLEGIGTSLNKMKDYLRKILHEYERIAFKFDNGIKINYSNLVQLDEFTYTSTKDFKFPNSYDKRYRFLENFVMQYDIIIAKIGENLQNFHTSE